jgi:hypothetical protein
VGYSKEHDATKPRALQDLMHEIEIACVTIPRATIKEYAVPFSAVVNNALLLGGGCLEHL